MSSSLTGLVAGHLDALAGSPVSASAGAVPGGLLQALAQVPGPRDPRGRRYPLVPVLAMAVCAVLAGARSYAAIAEWAADAPPRLRARLGLPGAVRDLVTIWRVLTAVDPASLDRAVGAWVRGQLSARRPPGRRVVLAVDGKTIRGARANGGTAPHLLACLDHGTGVVLAQAAVGGKTNEVTMFTALLGQAGGLDGAVVTADAMHAQREHATWLHDRGAHCLVTVKGNQAGLLRQLKSLPCEQVPEGHVHNSRGHGRIEKRIVKVVTVTAGLAFPHAAQAIQVIRKTRRSASRRWRTETSYAITSLPAARARPARRMAPRPLEDREPAALGAASPSARTPLPHAPAPARTSWPPSVTWSSASCAWPGMPASPVRSGALHVIPHARSGCSQAGSDGQ